jgi:hypothetical protein
MDVLRVIEVSDNVCSGTKRVTGHRTGMSPMPETADLPPFSAFPASG